MSERGGVVPGNYRGGPFGQRLRTPDFVAELRNTAARCATRGPRRSYLNWLDTAITAVVAMIATSEEAECDRFVTDLRPSGIERYLAEFTGISGWQGVIEARNILSGLLGAICRQGGTATISPSDAHRFVMVALRALELWQQLVNQAADAVREPSFGQ
jgi:hypothetical protein